MEREYKPAKQGRPKRVQKEYKRSTEVWSGSTNLQSRAVQREYKRSTKGAQKYGAGVQNSTKLNSTAVQREYKRRVKPA